jgi:hypothetical protein
MLGNAVLALGAAATVALVVWIEMFAFALWSFDRDPGCRAGTDELCAFNFVAAMVPATLASIVAAAGTGIGARFLTTGRRVDAKVVLAGLVALLAIGHVWLLV